MPTKRSKPAYTPAQIKAIRESARLTQGEAAAKVGVKLRAWQSWESGERIPSAQSIILLRLLEESKI